MLVLAVVLIAFNLRAAISSASVLLESLQENLGFGTTAAALLPTLPPLTFAAAGAASAALARRTGAERAVTTALVLLAAGLAVRAVPATWALLAGTLLSSAGLAVCNVLLPAVVRSRFPDRIAVMTGVYTTVMSVGAALAAAAAIPMAASLGSPSLGLAFWTVPVVVTVAVWLLRGTALPEPAGEQGGAYSLRAAARSSLGRLITAMFALQALHSYVVSGWLPSILTSQGVSERHAGTVLGVLVLAGIPATFGLMALTRGATRLRGGFVVAGTSLAAGYTGLLVAPGFLPELWAVLLGLGLSGFPLVLAVISASGRSPAETTALSAFAQSAGYLIASAGPFTIGMLHGFLGSWQVPLLLLATLTVAQIACGWRLARH
ncbi:MFS transporter [Longispora albida]|uniref:MFS transporter n=1 Tax=Longispora albida TaxID=203523 RepID=UPI00037BAFA3|nr:MFS transporter [Longispora albida]